MSHLGEKAMTCGKYTQYSLLHMSQKLVFVDVWLIDMALTIKELLYVMPLIGAWFFACGLACMMTRGN